MQQPPKMARLRLEIASSLNRQACQRRPDGRHVLASTTEVHKSRLNEHEAAGTISMTNIIFHGAIAELTVDLHT